MSAFRNILLAGLVSAGLAACGDEADLPVSAGTGPNPQLPQPTRELIPTVDIAPAKGWPKGGKPATVAGLQVTTFADGLDHPRWLHTLPNGDILVAETNAPAGPRTSSPASWTEKAMRSAARLA